MIDVAKERIILFDGVCNFCNSSINFVIDHDPKEIFKFASLQSNFGQEIINQHSLQKIDSVIYLRNNKVFIKSNAALMIAKDMGLPYSLFYIFKILPLFLRNWTYDLIARKRYIWFGKMDACRMPDAALKARFLN